MEDQNKKAFLQSLADAIADWQKERLLALIKEGLSQGMSAEEIARQGLIPHIKHTVDRFQKEEIFFPEFWLSIDTLHAGLGVLIPRLKDSLRKENTRGKVVLGVAEGDMHDIGKNIVKVVLECEGYEVIDLGQSVPADIFIRAAEKHAAPIIAASTLMTPTLVSMEELVAKAKQKLAGKVKTIIGGEATSLEFAQRIGADAWAKDAAEGVHQINLLLAKL